MALKPYYQLAGQPARPQFLLRDHLGREFGVVEHYETDRAKPTGFALLEFFSKDSSIQGRPLVWLDLEKWAVVPGSGKHLPDGDFEAGLHRFLQGFSRDEREERKERAKRARFHEVIQLASQGFSIAYQELFPGELKREDFPVVEMGGRAYLVDDQYGIQPGDFRNQVTLVFIDQGPARAKASAAPGGAAPASASLLANWLFGQGYEILESSLDEAHCHAGLKALVENPELEKIYKARLVKMRAEGTLLGVPPKPYTPSAPAPQP